MAEKSRSIDTLVSRIDRKPFIPCRVIVIALGMIGGIFMYALRMNMSVAIIAMTNDTASANEVIEIDNVHKQMLLISEPRDNDFC